MELSWHKKLFATLIVALFLPVFAAAALLPARRRTLFVWGSAPLLANKYWAEAVAESGRETLTVMSDLYAINARKDFDRYFHDFAPRGLPRPVRFVVGACLALLLVLRRARVLHTTYWGFALGHSWLWRVESGLLRMAGVKTVIIPFGGDAYQYSRTIDTSIRHGLLASYPQLARSEGKTARRIGHWNRAADAVIPGFLLDGMGRWDVTICQAFVVDTRVWRPKEEYSGHDGRSGPVRILHTPNHRGFKGTEFLVAAVERLRAQGLQVDLVLLEKVSNDQVRETMREVDILAEQFIFTGYAMSGIEGMATGLPVLSNLDNEAYTRPFRRYSFLDECPVLSTTPETIEANLRRLITDPGLRRALGEAGRAYAEKYHSYPAAAHLFGAVYARLLDGSDIDLIHLYHPLKPGGGELPRIAHPLIENRLPPGG